MAIRSGIERVIAKHAKTWTVFIPGEQVLDAQFRSVPGATTQTEFRAWSVPASRKDLGVSFSGMGLVAVGDKVMLIEAKSLAVSRSTFQPNVELEDPDGEGWSIKDVGDYVNGTILPSIRTAQVDVLSLLITRKRVPA